MTSFADELREIGAQWALTYGEHDRESKDVLREQLMHRKKQILAEDEKPLIGDLRRAGFTGSSVWDLVNTKEAYPHLIDVLSDHASREYLSPTREGIFRSLIVKESDAKVLNTLTTEWRKGIGKGDKFLRWALAHAIAYLIPRKSVPDLAALMDGDEYSDDPFVRRLGRSEAGRKALAAKMEKAAA